MPLTTVMLGQGEGFATHAEVTAAIGVECYFSLPHHSLVALLQRERERSAPFGALSELFYRIVYRSCIECQLPW